MADLVVNGCEGKREIDAPQTVENIFRPRNITAHYANRVLRKLGSQFRVEKQDRFKFLLTHPERGMVGDGTRARGVLWEALEIESRLHKYGKWKPGDGMTEEGINTWLQSLADFKIVTHPLSESFLEYVASVVQFRWNYTPKKAWDFVHSIISAPDEGRIFVGIKNGQPIATGILQREDADITPRVSPVLSLLYVDPKYRDHGYGQRMVDIRLQLAKEWGYEKAYLDTTNMVAYHSKHGWRVLGDGTSQWSGPVTLMWRHV